MGKTLLKVLLRWLLCYVGKGKGRRRTVITESVSVGDLRQEGRKEGRRGMELCLQCGETVCVARENHTGADRKIFLCAALFLTPKRLVNTCPRRELCQSSWREKASYQRGSQARSATHLGKSWHQDHRYLDEDQNMLLHLWAQGWEVEAGTNPDNAKKFSCFKIKSLCLL